MLLPLPRGLALLLLGHDVLKLRPQRLDRRELVSDRDDRLEGPIELVDVCKDLLEALRAGLVNFGISTAAVADDDPSKAIERTKETRDKRQENEGETYHGNFAEESLPLLLKVYVPAGLHLELFSFPAM